MEINKKRARIKKNRNKLIPKDEEHKNMQIRTKINAN